MPQLQLLPPVRPPLGLYVRPGQNDHVVLQQLILEGRAPTGLVFEARRGRRHADLLDVAVDAGLDAVLDPNTQEAWSLGGRALSGVAEFPWASPADGDETALQGTAGDDLVESIAHYVKKFGFTSVLTPTHYLAGPSDPEFELDISLARRLRTALNAQGLEDLPLYYPLAMPASSLKDAASRALAVRRLMRLDIDGLWLRLHPFGTSASGSLALRRYMAICDDFARLQIPLVAERTGTVGVALLAFGAVGGIECGVTLGERFDGGRLTRAAKGGDPYSHPPMVYSTPIGQFAEKKAAKELFEVRGTKAALGCRDGTCCRRGPEDMLRDPRRHGLIQRIREVNEIANIPPHRRATEYVETFVRRGSDVAVRFASQHPTIDKARKRLDSWRGTLSVVLDDGAVAASPVPAVGLRVRRPGAPARPKSI